MNGWRRRRALMTPREARSLASVLAPAAPARLPIPLWQAWLLAFGVGVLGGVAGRLLTEALEALCGP